MDNPFELEVDLHKPTECSKCNGDLEYNGLGTYKCVKCEHIERDDYAKVRAYIEKHQRVNVAKAAAATGVSRRTIQMMLDEKRFSTVTKRYIDAN